MLTKGASTFFSATDKKTLLSKSFLTILLCCIWSATYSQKGLDPDKRLGQYIVKSWGTADGLNSASTNDLIQSKDGYIWISTYTGLHRFDGTNFRIFNSQNSNLPSSNVLKMDIDQEGHLWVGTLHGLAKFQDGDFIVPEGLNESRKHGIEAMLITKNNTVWFSTKSNYLFCYRDGVLSDLTSSTGQSKSTITAIAEGDNGQVFFGTDASQLISYTEQTGFTELSVSYELNGINAIYSTTDNLYVGSGNGLFILRGNKLDRIEALENNTVTSIIKANINNIWVGTMKGVIRLNLKNTSIETLKESNGLPNNLIRDLLLDTEGNLWGGTYRNGIFMMVDGNITNYSSDDGLASDIITGVAQMDDSTFLLGSENGKLNLLRNEMILPFESKIQLPSERLKHLMKDSKNNIWASTYAGLYLISENENRGFTVQSGFPDNFIRMTYEDHRGWIWVGTKNAGLVCFKSIDDQQVLNVDDGLTSNYIMSITQNSKNQLIVGTISGISIIENLEVVETITINDGLPSNFSFSIYPKGDFLWIASNDGLIRYSDSATFTFNPQNGMPSNIIYDILEDSSGNFWLPSDNAIIKVSIDDLNDLAKSDIEKGIHTEIYNQSHGMKNSKCLGAVFSLKDANNDFWVPTLGGMVLVQPSKINYGHPNTTPILEEIFADGKRLSLAGSIIVPSGTDRVNIKYTGLNFRYAGELSFRYRLQPFDDSWIEAGTSRSMLYTSIPPGDYTLEIQSGLSNQYASPILTTKIKFKASWQQSIWAKVLAFLILVTVAISMNRYRVRALKIRNTRLEEMVSHRTVELVQQKQELSEALKNLSEAQEKMVQSEKMASLGLLSAGVAHEINNPLNFIKGGINLLDSLDFKTHPESKKIYELISIINEGVKRASGIVSNLNQFSHNREGHIAPCNINDIINNCLSMLNHQTSSGIDLRKNLSKEVCLVKGNSGQLHQVFINILTNAMQAVKNGQQVSVITRKENNMIVVEIKDKGHGIAPEDLSKITEPFYTTKQPGEGTGLGLSIAYSIIKEHQGILTFESQLGQGTRAKIEIPFYTTA